jgi:hypothetical protein
MKNIFSILYLAFLMASCGKQEFSPDYKIEFGKVAYTSVFESDTMSIWGGSLVKGQDGFYHMYYSRWPKNLGWAWVTHSEVAHAISNSPFGPFVKHDGLVFAFEGERFPAEDPYIWYQDGRYRAIVKRIKHEGQKRTFSLVQYDSEDGFDWRASKYHDISERIVEWNDGRQQQFTHLERPQVFLENGEPEALLCAADTLDANNVRHSFNIQIPLKITKE